MISTNYNPSVLTTQRNLNLASFSLNTALERMSTGYKVNCAADDAAGMFVASNLNANIRGLKQAQKNAQDGISLLNTAEGSLSNMTNILNRLRDLAVQGANGVYDENSLDAMQNEADSLVAQLKQIQQGTLFNGKSIFNTNATWNLTTQNAGTATISTLSGGGVSAKTPDTNSLAGINTLNSTPDAKSTGSGFIQQINRLSEDEAIAQGYTVIKTAQDLDNIRNDLDGKYILMNDIDLSGFDWDPIGEFDHSSFTPISSFTGILNGNGYSIKNMSATDKYNFGLFCSIDGAEVKNLNIENFTFKLVNEQGGTGTPVAFLANDSQISNCISSGNMSANSNDTKLLNYSTGFLGFAQNTIIENCNSTININDTYIGCAGFVSTAVNVDIKQCSYGGTMKGIATAGLLFQGQDCNILNSCVNGRLETDNSFGLASLLYRNSSIKNCYIDAEISVTAQSDVANYLGVCGASDGTVTLSNVNWNIDKCASGMLPVHSDGSATFNGNVNSLTTSQMEDPANWQGWDDTVWDFSTYPPKLKWQTQSSTNPGGDTDADDPNTPGGGDVPIPGAVRLQIGSDSCSTSAIYVDTSFDLGAFDVDFSSADSCAEAIEDIDEVLSRINTKRSEFGAVINRLSSILESQTTTIQNFTSAKSTIMDADIANESADFVKNQILQQTSSALLAQSQNLHASIVLSLIG